MEKTTEEKLNECIRALLLLSEILTQSRMPLCAKLAHDTAIENSLQSNTILPVEAEDE